VKASEAMSAVGLVVGAGISLIPALVLLLMALAAWIEELAQDPRLPTSSPAPWDW
jgi:hypothetical protein